MKFFENYMESETTTQKHLFEEDMQAVPPTLLELYEHDQDMFIDVIHNRKKNCGGIYDVSKSLDEDSYKALDMISFIVSKFPQSLTEREIYLILMKTSNPQDSAILPRETLDKMEKMLKNPRYKTEVSNYRTQVYFKSVSQNIMSIFQ
jgi:hypothetical protein